MTTDVTISDGNHLRAIREDTAKHFGLRHGEIVEVGPRLLAIVREDIRRRRAALAGEDGAKPTNQECL